MQPDTSKLVKKFLEQFKPVSAVNARMPVKSDIFDSETSITPVNAAASETCIAVSILVLILALLSNAALKLASGIFTFCACVLMPVKTNVSIITILVTNFFICFLNSIHKVHLTIELMLFLLIDRFTIYTIPHLQPRPNTPKFPKNTVNCNLLQYPQENKK